MKRSTLTLAAVVTLLPIAAAAQDDQALVFSQYYRCTQGEEARADDAFHEAFAPILQRHVEAGSLTGFGWLAHSQGGAWRRALFTVGTDLAQMMETRDQMVSELAENHADALTELGTACPGHDDYIWNGLTMSSPNPESLGNASISSYHMCDRADEGRADEVFAEVLAPLYQKHMDLGHIASWGWYAHRSGGFVRRLETMSGADHATLLQMQGAIYGEADPRAMRDLFEACETHTDYMWNNVTER